jgi:PGF-pre-PGF domain-containing protein
VLKNHVRDNISKYVGKMIRNIDRNKERIEILSIIFLLLGFISLTYSGGITGFVVDGEDVVVEEPEVIVEEGLVEEPEVVEEVLEDPVEEVELIEDVSEVVKEVLEDPVEEIVELIENVPEVIEEENVIEELEVPEVIEGVEKEIPEVVEEVLEDPVEEVELIEDVSEVVEELEVPEKEIIIESNVSVVEGVVKTEEVVVSRVIINRPVKWVKKVKLDRPAVDVVVEVPEVVEDISVYEIVNGERVDVEFSEGSEDNLITGMVVGVGRVGDIFEFIGNLFSKPSITGYAVEDVLEDVESKEIVIEEEVSEVEVEYYTEGPGVIEEEISESRKKVVVYSDIHYENILAYTSVRDVGREAIKLYRTTEGREEVEIIDYVDNNDNGLIDEIYWIVPHLSNESYEIEIAVLNVQSYPTVGGNWEVRFNTSGVADLRIRAINETDWSDSSEDYDLKFLEVRCGDEVLDYTWDDGVFVSNYSCSEVGYEVSKVLTMGKHDLEFDFGGMKDYAHNTACGDVITEDTVLTSNLSCPGQHGINIGADDITLDCAGYTISSDNTNYKVGINITRRDNVVVKNCNVLDFWNGLYSINMNNSLIFNNTVSADSRSFQINKAGYGSSHNNNISFNLFNGTFYSRYMNDSTVNSNTFEDKGGWARFDFGNNLTFKNNRLSYDYASASLYLASITNSFIINNTMNSSYYPSSKGISIASGVNNTFVSNNVGGDVNESGIYWQIQSSWGNQVITTFNKTNITNEVHGFKFYSWSKIDPYVNDCIQVSGTIADFYLVTTASAKGNPGGIIDLTILNCSYSTVLMDSDGMVGGGINRINRNWYYRVYVNDTSGNPVPNARILQYANSTLILNETTNSSGWIDKSAITAYINTNEVKVEYNIFNVSYGRNVYNYTFNGTANENTLNHSITLELFPVVNLISPANNTGDSDGNLTFNYNVTDLDDISNCSLLINNVVNQTDTSIYEDEITKSFILNNVKVGRYNWSVNCTEDNGLINGSETRVFSVIPNNGYDGEDTTDLTAVNVSNVTNLTLDETTHGRIRFTEEVDLSEGVDIDAYVEISQNRVEIDTTLLPALNKSARILLRGVPTYRNPQIIKDGDVCSPDECNVEDNANGTLTFTVTGFSVYTSQEGPQSQITGGSGGGGGYSKTVFKANTEYKRTYPGLEASTIIMMFKEGSTGDYPQVRMVESVPSFVKDVDGEVYKYVEIHANDLDVSLLESASIEFNVEKSWLEENEFSRYDVGFYRYHNDAWMDLDVKVIDNDDEKVYYSADVPGFSYFVISGKKDVVEEEKEVSKEIEEKEVEIKFEEEEFIPIERTRSGWSIGFIVLMIIICCIIFRKSLIRRNRKKYL